MVHNKCSSNVSKGLTPNPFSRRWVGECSFSCSYLSVPLILPGRVTINYRYLEDNVIIFLTFQLPRTLPPSPLQCSLRWHVLILWSLSSMGSLCYEPWIFRSSLLSFCPVTLQSHTVPSPCWKAVLWETPTWVWFGWNQFLIAGKASLMAQCLKKAWHFVNKCSSLDLSSSQQRSLI